VILQALEPPRPLRAGDGSRSVKGSAVASARGLV